MSDENAKLLILWFVYFLYMIIGALVFMELEYESEENKIASLQQLFSRVANRTDVYDELRAACSQRYESRGYHNKWDLAGSFYFAGTVITTVGFGLASPATTAGQICFLPYALLGIPLHVLLFNTLLDRAVFLMTYLLRRLHNAWETLKSPRATTGDPSAWEPSTALIAVVSALAVAAFVLISAPLFVFMEGWTFFEAVYFAVVTYTTVGFGDFVPSASHMDEGQNLSIHYKVGNWLVITVGIVFMYPAMAVIATVYKQLLDAVLGKCYTCRKLRRNRIAVATAGQQQMEALSCAERSATQDNLDDDRQRRFAQMVIKNWRSHHKASKMQGTLNTVEASILKSRLSQREVHVTSSDDHVDKHAIDDSESIDDSPSKLRRAPLAGHVTNNRCHPSDHVPNTLEEFQAEEARLLEEFSAAMNKLQQQKLRLISTEPVLSVND